MATDRAEVIQVGQNSCYASFLKLSSQKVSHALIRCKRIILIHSTYYSQGCSSETIDKLLQELSDFKSNACVLQELKTQMTEMKGQMNNIQSYIVGSHTVPHIRTSLSSGDFSSGSIMSICSDSKMICFCENMKRLLHASIMLIC